MDKQLSELIEALKQKLSELTEDQRLEVFSQVTDGWCVHCGYSEPRGTYCQCTNDE